ncbi:MAG TPA: MaoC family dehydratase N-terminal domain-containing protein [Actinomycetota bacterium]
MPLNLALEGKVYPEVAFTVDPGRAAAFAAVVEERSDVVPPTFPTAAEFLLFPQIVGDPELGMDFTRVVHAEQEYEWRRALVPGETVSARSRLAQIREKAGNGFLTIETQLLGADGEVAVVARASMIERGEGG